MNLLVLGSPASGKGTQAEMIVKKLNYQYFEAGDILREIAQEKSSLGQKINRIMKEGKLLPNQIMDQVAAQWLVKTKIKKGVVFDGYPRKLSQYPTWQKMLAEKGKKVDKVIYLKISQETSIKRIAARRVCSRCDAEYNLVTKLPQRKGVCDQCQEKLIQRQDDNSKTVRKRLKTYYRLTKPLVGHIRRQGILEEVDGERSIEDIHQDIMARLKQ